MHNDKNINPADLENENFALKSKIAELEEAVKSITDGDIDAILSPTPSSDKIFLHESQQSVYRLIIEEMSEAALTLSEDGIILFCNRSFANYLQLPKENILGRSILDFVSENTRTQLTDLIKSSTIKRGDCEIKLHSASNTIIDLRLDLYPFPADNLHNVCVIAFDLTKILEKEAQLNDANLNLEKRVSERTEELRLLNKEINNGRIAALNMMQDVVEAKNSLEIINEKLNSEIKERQSKEEALAESEEKFRSISHSAKDAIVTSDSKGIIIGWNPGAENIFGYTKEEITGKDLTIIVPKDYHNRGLQGMKRIANNSAKNVIGKTVELHGLHKNGKEFPIELSLAEWVTQKGKYFTGIIRDITERKEKEKQLHDQTQLLANVLNIMPVGLWITDNKGKIIHVNPAGQKIWAGAKYVGLEQLGEYKGWWLENGKRIEPQEWAVTRAITKRETSLNEEIEIECFDGTRKIILNSAMPILNSENEILAAIVTNQDITEKKRYEQNLQKLNRAIEQSSVSVIITDAKGNIDYVNPFFTTLTGYTFNEVEGKNPNIISSGQQSKLFYKEFWDTILTGNVWQGELLNKKKNGELYWENATISPVINQNGEIVNFVAVKDDITERKRILDELVKTKDEAEKANKLKSEFLAQMSHEIRSPLNVVIGHHSLLKELIPQELIEEFHDIFSGVESASRRIIRTIDLILNMAEIQTGSYNPELKPIDLNEHIFSRLLIEFRHTAQLKKLDLFYENHLSDIKLLADEYSVLQIFTNLIDNAIKYTNQGSITINLFRNQRQDIVVEVTDTGIGMSDEFLENLFEPFIQEEKGYSRSYEGNGLGLSLVKEYCNINNALIEVESKKNHGSTFRVVFNGR